MHKHRLDALTDGIFAVAMTLLVIELKLPEAEVIRDSAELGYALAHLIPKVLSWVISFSVLAIFWWGHHRVMHHVKQIDGKLVAINLMFLAAVSFMPFASSISGNYPRVFASQIVYSGTMALTGCAAIALWRYVHRHPELCETPMSEDAYRGARVRIGMLMAVSVLACLIAFWFAPAGNTAFMLMVLSRPLTRWMGKRSVGPAQAG
ncbi:MAG: DUF1211 domain-containing protein [Ramlibacter sp.]|nr:DUF1211 domain-containing protein [Ramlibacter sp.]